MAYKSNASEFYKGNSFLPKAGTLKDFSPEKAKEVERCMLDPIYFAEKYFKIVHQDADDGVIPLKLYPYQKRAINVFMETNRLLMATARQVGKAVNVNELVPLHDGGFKTIGDLKVGDKIIGSDGRPTTVTFKSEIFNKPSYRVTFEDNTSIDVCEDHLWTVTNRVNHRKVETKDTKRLSQDFRKLNARGYYEYRYCIDNIEPVKYVEREQSIDPYVLGAWLGDGSKSGGVFACHQDDKQHYIDQGVEFTTEYSYEHTRNPRLFTSTIKGASPLLRKIGVLENKHIPFDYLYGSAEQRLALLQGLMDTDGHVRTNGLCEIQLSDKVPQLIEDINQLLCSLGIKVFRSSFQNNNFKQPAPSTRLTFTPPCGMQVARIPRKKDRLKSVRPFESYTNSRSITNIEPIEPISTQCIQVDSPDHLFAVTDKYILTHNTTIATVLILWIALFNKRKNIALLADKQDTATEVLDRIQTAYEYLPDFLKGGVKEWNKKSVEFENGSKIFASATGSSAIRGKSIFFLYIDEVAHVEGWDDFAASVLPTISSSKKAKVVFTSTPNGMNHFYDYYKIAKEKQAAGPLQKGHFPLVEVPWWEVEGRDEQWKEDTLAEMRYNHQKFAQEQEVEFLGSSGTLINGASLKILDSFVERVVPEYNDPEMGLTIFKSPEKGQVYALVADVSRGVGQDYHAFHVFNVTTIPYVQVCRFHNNKINASDYASIIDRIGKHYNYAQVLIELNDNGGTVIEVLFMIHQYENLLMTESNGVSGKVLSGGMGSTGRVDRGIRTTHPVKSAGCAMIKMIIEQQQLVINDAATVEELKTFSSKKQLNPSSPLRYEAEEGKHDDLVMGLVLFGWMSNQPYFKDLVEMNIVEHLRETSDDDLEDYLIPMGVINNGINGNIDFDAVDADFGTVSSSDFERWMQD